MKQLIKKILFNANSLRRPSVSYCVHNNLLPEVFVKTSADRLRELFFLPELLQETQLNQDLFALIVNQFRLGYFLEIGANDGYTLSNTVYLEEKFGWRGLLVEANPQYQKSLMSRKANVVIAAVAEKESYYEFTSAGLYGGITKLLDNTHEKNTRHAESITVWGTTLARILKENDAPEVINFISVDVEGAEVPIVEQMCRLESYRFVCGCIEHNARGKDYKRINSLLEKHGYRVVWSGQTAHDIFFIDGMGMVARG